MGKLASEGQCHAVLDDAEDVDADSIPGSNSTYEFVGADAQRPEMLFTRVYACACRSCRAPTAVSTEYTACPHMSIVGSFQQQTIHPAVNVPRQRQKQLLDAKTFATQLLADHVYAVFASHAERGIRYALIWPAWILLCSHLALICFDVICLGGYKYWLIRAMSQGKTGQTIKVPGGRTIAKNQWFVDAQWYISTSDDAARKSYKLLPEIVQVPIGALVQEHGLRWEREGRGPDGENILSNDSRF